MIALQDKPTSVMILGREFAVKYVKKVDANNSYGLCDGPERVIKIKDGLNPTLLRDTLLHECIHAILYISGQSEHLKHKQEEAIVVALENGLAQLILME